MIISHSFLLRMRNVSDRIRENEGTYFQFSIFFNENNAVVEIMWENTVQLDRPQMTVQYGACALHAIYLRLQTHIQNHFSSATMVARIARTRFSVTFARTLPVPPPSPVAQQPPVPPSLSRLSITHRYTPQSVGLLYTSDHPDTRDLYMTTHDTYNRQTRLPPSPPDSIRTRSHRKRVSADSRLSLHGHRYPPRIVTAVIVLWSRE